LIVSESIHALPKTVINLLSYRFLAKHGYFPRISTIKSDVERKSTVENMVA